MSSTRRTLATAALAAMLLPSAVEAGEATATPQGVAEQPSPWVTLRPGLDRRVAQVSGATLLALRFDLRRYRPRVVLADDSHGATVRQIASVSGALVAVNGGFYDAAMRPVGLRVAAGRRLSGRLGGRLGALVIRGNEASVVLGDDEALVAGADEVVQCGPRLVVDGKANRVKAQTSRRTVAGVDQLGRLVLLVTQRGVIQARTLAALLAATEAEGGYALRDALNLDGGPSTQLVANLGDESIDVAGMPVADALIIVERDDVSGR